MNTHIVCQQSLSLERWQLTRSSKIGTCLRMLLCPSCNMITGVQGTILNRLSNCPFHNQSLLTFLSKSYGTNGNRTNGNKLLRDWSLSLKRRSGVESASSSATTSHPHNSLSLIHHMKIALRTLSSDVTVRSWCCKTILCYRECLWFYLASDNIHEETKNCFQGRNSSV
jgi:hypothetical protein